MVIAYLPIMWEAVPFGDIIATVQIMDRDVACATDDEADSELLHAIEIIDGYLSNLVDTCLRAAIDCEIEHAVSAGVAVPELAALAQHIPTAVRVARPYRHC